MPTDNQKGKVSSSYFKWGVGIASILIILVGLYWGVEYYLESDLQDRIQQTADRLGGERYDFQIDEFNLSIQNRQAGVYGLSLQPSSEGGDSLHIKSIKIDSISIDNFDLISYLMDGTISIGKLSVANPRLVLVGRIRKNILEDFSSGAAGKDLGRSLAIDHFQITNGSGKLEHPSDGSREAEIANLNLDLHQIRLDSTTVTAAPYIKYGGITLGVGNIYTQTYENFYDIMLGAINVSSSDSTISLDSLQIEPRYPRYKFAQEYGFEIDRISANIPSISVSDIDLQGLWEERVVAKKISISQAMLDIFHDKHMPAGPKSARKLLQQTFFELPLFVNIDTVSIDNSRITYSEHLPQPSVAGEVIFADLSATIVDLQNNSEKPIRMNAQTSLMESSQLQVNATFPNTENGMHRLTGSLGAMEMKALNPAVEPMGFVSLSSGTINAMEFDMELDQAKAKGKILLNYSDLKVQLLEKEQVNEDKHKQLLSFLANAVKIKQNNTEKPLREGEITFERDPHKSIVNYWWKALLSGLKSSIGM